MLYMILTRVSSGSTSSGSMLTWASLSTSATGVSEHGVGDCMAATAGEASEPQLRLKEILLRALESNRSNALMGAGI